MPVRAVRVPIVLSTRSAVVAKGSSRVASVRALSAHVRDSPFVSAQSTGGTADDP